MALVNGTNLVLYAVDGGTNYAFGHSRSFTLNLEANPIDVTSRDSQGWSESIMGSRSFTLDFEGLVDYGDYISPAWIKTAIDNKTKFLVKFTDNLAGALVYNGYVYVSSMTIDAPMEDVVTYSGTLQGTEIFATAIAPGPTPGGDPDAEAFLLAAGITDPTQSSAVNTLVEDLKAENLWTKFYAIYPFVGGSASTHKFNLKNPLDTDAAYRLAFNGSFTHDASGALPVTSGGPTDPGPYANTFMTNKDLTNFHVSYYSATQTAAPGSDSLIGTTDYTGPNTVIALASRNASDQTSMAINQSSVDIANTDGRGFYLGSRSAATGHSLYKNGVEIGTTAYTAAETGTMANYPLYIFSISTGSIPYNFYATNKKCAFASIGTALTDAEVLTFYNIVQDFQTTLSRNV